ncbi:MAG: tRNA preQ1(34) S-adenosylmethionine ribosyltransferase-isomerase QueA [Phycisphaerae bacterium]|nr:tRNA preQ1(34) S-adenosylmethionine ribosyltransferase-isomerase QueA [Phycisphaerae bacterium]
MKTDNFDFELPDRLIAQHGLPERAESRLMVLGRQKDTVTHRRFSDIVEYIQPGDCLVLNDTRVIPARFHLRRQSGGRIEGLFLKRVDNRQWCALLRNAARLKPGEVVQLDEPEGKTIAGEPTELTIIEDQGQGQWLLEPVGTECYLDILQRYGTTPLPPYIRRMRDDENDVVDHERYQTVYAQSPGSVAAPTAGLHFTDALLEQLRAMSVRIAHVTLHVGMGTFKPVSVENLKDHQMHAEEYQLDDANAALINQTREEGGRVIAVGTTSVRTLETLGKNHRVSAGRGWTDIFITPGYEFQIVDGLITNFHLPKSTLLALVCAFTGMEQTLNAYAEAVQKEYRFYSYGDAMMII